MMDGRMIRNGLIEIILPYIILRKTAAVQMLLNRRERTI